MGYANYRRRRRAGGVEGDYLNGLIFGSSNKGASAYDNPSIFTNQLDTFDAERMLKLNHSDELVQFATPINNDQGITTYNLVNEDMYYGIAEQMITDLAAAYPDKKIALASACKSAVPIAFSGTSWAASRNGADPDDMTTRYGQVLSRAKALEAATGEPIDFVSLPDMGGDAGNSYLATVAYDGLIDLINYLRTDLNNPNLFMVFTNLAITPYSGYSPWDSMRTKVRDDLLNDTTNVALIDPIPDLGFDDDSVIWEYVTNGRSGVFTIGETILGGTSGNSERLTLFTQSGNRLWMEYNPDWTAGEVITGQSSGVTANVNDPLSIANVHYNTEHLNEIGAEHAVKIINHF